MLLVLSARSLSRFLSLSVRACAEHETQSTQPARATIKAEVTGDDSNILNATVVKYTTISTPNVHTSHSRHKKITMATKYEQSKTYQYRKVMKPLLERKRRARINKCLDDLKDLMAECVAQTGDAKFEKADILEVTVQYLRKLKESKATHTAASAPEHSFRAGYIRAANEVSRALAALPKVDVAFGTTLMTHLGMRLNQLEQPVEQSTPMAPHTPLSINCGANTCSTSSSSSSSSRDAFSPVSSGYASDSDCGSSSSVMAAQSLLQISNNGSVWRPW